MSAAEQENLVICKKQGSMRYQALNNVNFSELCDEDTGKTAASESERIFKRNSCVVSYEEMKTISNFVRPSPRPTGVRRESTGVGRDPAVGIAVGVNSLAGIPPHPATVTAECGQIVNEVANETWNGTEVFKTSYNSTQGISEYRRSNVSHEAAGCISASVTGTVFVKGRTVEKTLHEQQELCGQKESRNALDLTSAVATNPVTPCDIDLEMSAYSEQDRSSSNSHCNLAAMKETSSPRSSKRLAKLRIKDSLRYEISSVPSVKVTSPSPRVQAKSKPCVKIKSKPVKKSSPLKARKMIKEENHVLAVKQRRKMVEDEDRVINFLTTKSLLWCDDCRAEKEGICTIHGPLTYIPSGKLDLDFQPLSTLPDNMFLSKSTAMPEKLGVFTQQRISSRHVLGPIKGDVLNVKVLPASWNTDNIWQVFDANNDCLKLIDCCPTNSSNWTCFLQAARYEGEQNLVAVQVEDQLYFMTTREIREREELLYWYNEYYGARMGVARNPETVAEGTKCNVGGCTMSKSRSDGSFACPNYLVRHMSLGHKRSLSGEAVHYCIVCYIRDKVRFHYNRKLELVEHIMMEPSHTPHICLACNQLISPDLELSYIHKPCDQILVLKKKREEEKRLLRQANRLEREKKRAERAQKRLLAQAISTNNENREEAVDIGESCEMNINKQLKPPDEIAMDDSGDLAMNSEGCRTANVISTQPPKETGVIENISRPKKKRRKKVYREKMCKYCGKLIQANSIAKHEKRHIGIRPIKKFQICPICGIQTKSLYRHKDTHAGAESRKKFSCPYCGKDFMRSDNLKTHVRRHTGDLPFVCQFCGKAHTTKQWRDNHEKKCSARGLQSMLGMTAPPGWHLQYGQNV